MILFVTFDLCSSFALRHENEFTHSFSSEKPSLNDEKPKLCKKIEKKKEEKKKLY